MDVQDLFGEIRRFAKACPEPTMQDALIRAARTLSRESWILRRQFDIMTVAGEKEYDLLSPVSEEIFALKYASILIPGGGESPLSYLYTSQQDPNEVNQRPWAYDLIAYKKVHLYPTPDAVYRIRLESITQPVSESAKLPDELALEFEQGLGYGALDWILRMPDETWYNPNAADYNARMFRTEVVRARRKAMYDHRPNSLPWARRRFA